MTTRPRRRKTAAPEYEIIEPLQRWRILGGRYYRDHVARRSDGELRLVSILDEPGVAA